MFQTLLSQQALFAWPYKKIQNCKNYFTDLNKRKTEENTVSYAIRKCRLRSTKFAIKPPS